MTKTDNVRKLTDSTVDRFFGEPVDYTPWLGDPIGGGYSSTGGADASRTSSTVIGIETTAPTDSTSITGDAAKFLTSGMWLSIQESFGVLDWRRGDRVYLPERGYWYEVNFVAPSATRRPNVHIIRLKKP